ncbi:MAG TPA: Gfo/Idh/MocA family oxidoreductase [Candidatus Sulfotelmatobacter sp.]|jgi:scyllo-inositol 2-dehydrogenase (NADP+)|nr:Gfo/Idh/MocA family oxidoreductase [Candidatus Sulfotelmatobacter sp.]
MIDAGLIGFGLGGRAFHAPFIATVPGLRLAAVLQRTGDDAARIYAGTKIVRTLDELLAISSIRLIAISTPNHTHFPFAKACLEAGRYVVVDKPFTTTLAEANELVALAQKTGRLLTVYQERRWDGDFKTLQLLLASEALGRVVHFESTFDRCRPQVRDSWKEKPGPGNGIFFDLGPHLLDHALKLFGPPEALLADIRVERDGGVNDDAFDATFYYANGMRAALSSSTLAPVARPHFRVLGTKATFIKQNLDPQEALLRSGCPASGDSWGAEREEEWGTLTEFDGAHTKQSRIPTLQGDYRGFYENVRDVMLGTAKPAVTHEEMLRVMYALELAKESSTQRKALPWKL